MNDICIIKCTLEFLKLIIYLIFNQMFIINAIAHFFTFHQQY